VACGGGGDASPVKADKNPGVVGRELVAELATETNESNKSLDERLTWPTLDDDLEAPAMEGATGGPKLLLLNFVLRVEDDGGGGKVMGPVSPAGSCPTAASRDCSKLLQASFTFPKAPARLWELSLVHICPGKKEHHNLLVLVRQSGDTSNQNHNYHVCPFPALSSSSQGAIDQARANKGERWTA